MQSLGGGSYSNIYQLNTTFLQDHVSDVIKGKNLVISISKELPILMGYYYDIFISSVYCTCKTQR